MKVAVQGRWPPIGGNLQTKKSHCTMYMSNDLGTILIVCKCMIMYVHAIYRSYITQKVDGVFIITTGSSIYVN